MLLAVAAVPAASGARTRVRSTHPAPRSGAGSPGMKVSTSSVRCSRPRQANASTGSGSAVKLPIGRRACTSGHSWETATPACTSKMATGQGSSQIGGICALAWQGNRVPPCRPSKAISSIATSTTASISSISAHCLCLSQQLAGFKSPHPVHTPANAAPVGRIFMKVHALSCMWLVPAQL